MPRFRSSQEAGAAEVGVEVAVGVEVGVEVALGVEVEVALGVEVAVEVSVEIVVEVGPRPLTRGMGSLHRYEPPTGLQ